MPAAIGPASEGIHDPDDRGVHVLFLERSIRGPEGQAVAQTDVPGRDVLSSIVIEELDAREMRTGLGGDPGHDLGVGHRRRHHQGDVAAHRRESRRFPIGRGIPDPGRDETQLRDEHRPEKSHRASGHFQKTQAAVGGQTSSAFGATRP
jgi:hypothetical protein